MINKIKRPRKLKKRLGKNGVLVYDLAGLPMNSTVRTIHHDFHNFGLVLWSSSASQTFSGRDCNNPPMVVGNVRKFKVIDISNK